MPDHSSGHNRLSNFWSLHTKLAATATLSKNEIDSPVIIIGAGRSGTNILRDLLVSHSGYVTWPCDEINYIWRHGNRDFHTDQFSRSMANPIIKKYVRQQFASIGKKCPSATIVEKTCANSLRCGFVHEIFPNARFVQIIRDGRDVAASAALRWNAKLDIPYLLKKVRFVPWNDLPFYGFKYIKARVFRLISGKKRLSTWGPRFNGMEDAFLNHELPVGCAIQWRQCVLSSLAQLDELPDSQVLTLRYESFVNEPVEELHRVFQFLKTDVSNQQVLEMAANVSNRSVGKWQKQLTETQIKAIHQVAGDCLSQLGYE